MGTHREFYASHLGPGGEVVLRCPFHTDDSPSFSLNLRTGKWKCHTPTCKGWRGGGRASFAELLGAGGVVDPGPLDDALVESHHRVLLRMQDRLDYLREVRGLDEEAVRRRKLGHDGERYWIPVADESGAWVNIRKYLPEAKGKDKVVSYGAGYGRARLYPLAALVGSGPVLLCEGEMDALCAGARGYAAVTTTGGAGSWREEFTAALAGREVVVCYDADEAGRAGAETAARALLGRASSVRVARLPLPGTKAMKDVTDFFVKAGKTREDLDAVLAAAAPYAPPADAPGGGDDGRSPQEVASGNGHVREVHLSKASEGDYVGAHLGVMVRVAGKDLAPFNVPWAVRFKCSQVGSEDFCDACGISKAGGESRVELTVDSREVLEMVNVPQHVVDRVVHRLGRVPGRCKKYQAEVQEYASVEAIKAIPEVDFSAEDAEYVIRQLYFLGHGIETNATFRMEMTAQPDPKTQYATALAYAADPAQDSLDRFSVSDQDVAALRVFQVPA